MKHNYSLVRLQVTPLHALPTILDNIMADESALGADSSLKGGPCSNGYKAGIMYESAGGL